MDFYLRCNSLQCRVQLKERAVVTTCSHIFCLSCADGLGLSRPTAGARTCPACQTVLSNPDDAVSTILNPTEDYKTSVLSGLDPNTIMECAGRALGFWAYQSTQEILYQEFLGKTLTEKYTSLSTQMDKVIHNANSEISCLQAKLSDMQATQEQLQKKNQEMTDLFREKSKKLTQMTNLYNLLKARAMRSRMQTAASDSVSQTLNSLSSRNPFSVSIPSSGPPPVATATTTRPQATRPQTTRPPQSPSYEVNKDGVEQLHRYQRSGTGSSSRVRRKDVDATAMPPPNRPTFNGRNPQVVSATPQHRTRLPGPSRPSTALSQVQIPHGDAKLEQLWR